MSHQTRAARQLQVQVFRVARQLIAHYKGMDEDEVDNTTTAGWAYRNIVAKLKLAFQREPVYDAAHPPSEHMTLAELVTMFTALPPDHET